MPTVFVLNGPNLNLLGTREPAVYGAQTLADVEALCRAAAAAHGWGVDFRQSNHEGVLVDWIHEAAGGHAAGEVTGVVLNAGAYTHTSVALHDAMKGVAVPVVEVHLSNVHAREAFRQHSYLSPAAAGIIVGFGANGYALAIEGLARRDASPSSGAKKGKTGKARR
jgi:3-dehydroquinate dehydratase-2